MSPVEYAEPLATCGVNAHHSLYVDHGATTDAPELLADYDADPAVPGTLLMVMDRDGWATLHRIERRDGDKITFGPRIPWPDGAIAARKVSA